MKDRVTEKHYNESWGRGPQAIRKYFENFAGLTRDIMPYLKGKVLEMGCGPAFAGRLCPWYWGVDWSEEAIRIARRDVPHGLFYLADVERQKMGWADKFFDTVLLKEILEHLEDYSLCLSEAKRLAKTTIVITVPGDIPIGSHYHPAWTEEDCRRIFGALGLVAELYFTRGKWWVAVIDVEG